MPRSDYLKVEVYGFLEREGRDMTPAELKFYLLGPWRRAWELGQRILTYDRELPRFAADTGFSVRQCRRLLKQIIGKFPNAKQTEPRPVLSLSDNGNSIHVHGVSRVNVALRRFRDGSGTGTETGPRTGTAADREHVPQERRGKERRGDHTNTRGSAKKPKKSRKPFQYPKDFEDCFEHYPRPDAKRDALREFDKRKKEGWPQHLLHDAFEAFGKHWRDVIEEKQYVPHCRKWLHSGDWERWIAKQLLEAWEKQQKGEAG